MAVVLISRFAGEANLVKIIVQTLGLSIPPDHLLRLLKKKLLQFVVL